MTVIADAVTVSTPIGNGPDLREALADVCLQIPESQTDPLGIRLGKFGLLRFSERGNVAIASASGVMLAGLRAANLLADYAAAVASVVTYNVSHLDLAHDESCDAPAVLQRRYKLYRLAGVALTRKRIPGSKVKCLFSPGDDGRDTGSIMFGNRKTMQTSAIMYDRHHDALEKGKPDPGMLLRTEVRTGIPGMTLRDVLHPAPLFYHFAAPGLIAKPDDVPQWEPHGGGYSLNRPQVDAQDKLRRQVERSTDLGAMYRLVDELPGEGLDVLVRLVRNRYKLHRQSLAFAAGRNAPCDSEQTPATPPPEAVDPDA